MHFGKALVLGNYGGIVEKGKKERSNPIFPDFNDPFFTLPKEPNENLKIIHYMAGIIIFLAKFISYSHYVQRLVKKGNTFSQRDKQDYD